MIVKVCGMREAENIRAVEALGIDMMGFIFYPKSKRYCAEVPEYLPTKCKRVGVFVNADNDFIAERVKAFGLDILQLHGDETAERVAEVKGRFGLPVIKAVNYPGDDIAGHGTPGETYGKVAENRTLGNDNLLLFETKCEGYGGSGRQFDWSVLEDYKGETPFLLTGGIGPEDAERVKAFRHPQFVGIDLNSRFEIASGLKSPELLRRFLQTLRQ